MLLLTPYQVVVDVILCRLVLPIPSTSFCLPQVSPGRRVAAADQAQPRVLPKLQPEGKLCRWSWGTPGEEVSPHVSPALAVCSHCCLVSFGDGPKEVRDAEWTEKQLCQSQWERGKILQDVAAEEGGV